MIRGLVVGMLGAFGAGGFVIGVAPTFSADLGAGSSGYGVLFASVFTGLAIGMWVGPRLLSEFTRWRLFAISIVVAGIWLALISLIPNIVLAVIFAALLGAGAGVAWVTGYTLLGLEVADELRGRTFAFVNSAARVVLVAVMAFAPALAALIGERTLLLGEDVELTYNGAAFTLLVASVVAIGIGFLSYRTMDDHMAVPLVADLVNAWRRRHVAAPAHTAGRGHDGFFVAFEGGDGAGKSSQLDHVAEWVRGIGHEVVLTREPGATELGQKIRQVLLHGEEMDPRAEALLFAADRAHHVSSVVLPALHRGAVVVTDRYVDSSVAYQGVRARLRPGRDRADLALGHRFAAARPHRRARRRPGRRQGAAHRRPVPRRTGWSRRIWSSTAGCATGSCSWPAGRRGATWWSTPPSLPRSSRGRCARGSSRCSRSPPSSRSGPSASRPRPRSRPG